MLTNNSHVVVTMYKCYDSCVSGERLASVLLVVITTYLTVQKMKTFSFLSVLERIVNFNYPVLLDEKGCPRVCAYLKNI